jgi:uncharacterized phage protein (TIGR01671 family)
MNRELKFRVWDKVDRQYLKELGVYYWHVSRSLLGEELEGEANLYDLSILLRNKSFVVQQYTGLTDGKGNNIYEGDILSHDKKIGTVYYNADRAGFVLEWEYSSHEQNYVNLTCDVAYESSNIGNIFKNPELLK